MNEELKTFIQVAESGSFSKAAENLFISPTAVMKQMNSLEKQTGVPLFLRTNHGVTLTEAGISFRKDAIFIMQYFQESLLRMRQTGKVNQLVIRAGTSMLNSSKIFLDIWNGISSRYPQFKINIIHFQDDAYTLPATYRTIGTDFDFIVGPLLTDNRKEYFRVLELGSYRFCFAVSRNHRLASKEQLFLKDLYGERLVILNGGNSTVIDEMIDFLKKHHPEIRLKIIPRLYDLEVFNRCVETETVLLTLDAWADIHPSLVTIPSDWDYSIPYGLLYPINPSENFSEFLQIIRLEIPEQKQTSHS